VKDVRILDESLPRAVTEQSVTLLLEDEIDVSRGDMIVKAGDAPAATRQLEAMVCWLGEQALTPGRRYLLRHTTRETKAIVAGIAYRVDVNEIEQTPADRLAMNDIGRVAFKLAQPVFADPYEESRATGAFIVVDEATNGTVGAGMIR
jgi:sulfate adenylyltransferase subunit 1